MLMLYTTKNAKVAKPIKQNRLRSYAFSGGKYTIMCISPMKVGYYEFEGEDRFPEEEDTPVKSKRLKLKYKPRDFKEALLLKRLEEGDEQLIRQITDAELSSQGILRNDSEMPVIQQQGPERTFR
jgi:hypothetical protein